MVDGMYVLETIEDWLYENGLVLGEKITSCDIENGNVVIVNGKETFMLTVVKN
tara:strand:+ start:3131 stop:3289 length:159 start_codon:yes stop_codon:yes gene_type:complete